MTLEPEQPVADASGHGFVRRRFSLERLARHTGETETPSAIHSHASVDHRRAEIDQETLRLQDPPRLGKGMNHAPASHSSKGPGEDRDAE